MGTTVRIYTHTEPVLCANQGQAEYTWGLHTQECLHKDACRNEGQGEIAMHISSFLLEIVERGQ